MKVNSSVKTFVKAHAPTQWLGAARALRYKNRTIKSIFTELYYKPNRDREMISGPGSDLVQTATIARAIPELIEELKVRTMLDAPCGDFYWMRRVELRVDSYTGVDIVEELIARHARDHASHNRRFMCLDITRDSLPKVDLILSRDALVHLSSRDCLAALANFKSSKSRYLLMTTFPAVIKNDDILTGEWRPINFEAPPFNLPPPLRLVNERCTEDGEVYRDKSLGLWKLDDILN